MDRLKLKIAILLFSSFFIIITSLYFVNICYIGLGMERQSSTIFSKNFEPSVQKIYLLGNSRIERLDTNFINKLLNEDGHNYTVYSLAKGGVLPVDTLPLLDKIIATKPILVLIGIDPTDMRGGKICNISDIVFIKNREAVINNPEYFKCVIPSEFHGINFQNFKDPRTTTLSLIKMTFSQDQAEANQYDPYGILTHQQLKNAVKMAPYRATIILDNNPNITALEKIITKLKTNGIKVVVIVTPRSQLYLNTIPKTEKQVFSSIVSEVQNKTEIKIYSLFDKYANLEIWSDTDHVTRDPKGLIYSQDVAKIIKDELVS